MKPWSVSFVVFLAVLAVTVAACWAIWTFMLQPTAEAVKTSNTLHERFTADFPVSPRIHANAGALFAQSSRTEEFVLLESVGTVRETLEGLLPQAQGLVVESTYTAKTGIRSRETFQLDVRAGGRLVDCTLPMPKILSLEFTDPTIIQPAGMDWNALPEKTRHRASRALERAAKRHLEEDRIPQKAREVLEASVAAIVGAAGCEPIFRRREIP
jgi:hypothetical protein